MRAEHRKPFRLRARSVFPLPRCLWFQLARRFALELYGLGVVIASLAIAIKLPKTALNKPDNFAQRGNSFGRAEK